MGLFITVYWGGYGAWPVIDNPNLANLRSLVRTFLAVRGSGWVRRRLASALGLTRVMALLNP